MSKTKKIIIMSLVCASLLMTLFLVPASAAVGDIVWNKYSMDDLFSKDTDFGSDDFEFTIIQPGWASANVYDVNSAIVSKLQTSGLFVGGKLLFPTVDSSKIYQVRLPLTFTDLRYDLRPVQVIINFYDSDRRVVRQVGMSNFSDSTESVYGIRMRTFNFSFNIAGSELNKCQYIDFFITVDNFVSDEQYIYFGVHKNNGLSIRETLSEDTQAIINNQNQNTQDIINNNNANTESIIQNEQNLQENEKNEANEGGNSGVNQLEQLIPNESDGFISAFQGLISAASYNGTECNWTLPSIKLPAIDGVMDEIVLTEDMEIDFEFWIDKIPTSIMMIVKSLLTAAIMVFGFKELYSLISYILTLKGGGGN